jgi:para-nitrobenzyl esterase
VRGGVLQSPHTSEVPFVFGTAPAAEALLGTGPDIVPLTRMMIATWSAFAHTGNPANPHLPTWPRYEATKESTMLLSGESTVASNPGGDRREALATLPPFEYSMPVNYPQA